MKTPFALILLAVAEFHLPSLGQEIPAQAASSPDVERETKLDTVIGKNLYACAGAALNEFELPKAAPGRTPARIRWGKRALVFPLLTPLKVRQAIVSGKVDTVETVALILEFPSGDRAAATGHLSTKGPLLEGDDLLEALIGGTPINLYAKIPGDFSKDGVESIQFRAVTRGMSSSEVMCARGVPEKTNDYGRAGQQWVYSGGHMLVYFDEDLKVEDIQEFE